MKKISIFSIIALTALTLASLARVGWAVESNSTTSGEIIVGDDTHMEFEAESDMSTDSDDDSVSDDEETEGDPDEPIITGQINNAQRLRDRIHNLLNDDDDSEEGIEHEDIGITDDESDMMHSTSSMRGGARLFLRASQVRGWDPEQKRQFMMQVKEHAQVHSGQDLENFAAGILLKDKNTEEVDVSSSTVRIRYHFPAKFLGFIPVDIPSDTSVTFGDGENGARIPTNVKVKFPWYRFLFGLDSNINSKNLGSALIDEIASSQSETDISAEEDVSFYARMLQTISAVMKARHDSAISQ